MSVGRKTLVQDAYFLNLAHSFSEGVRVNAYAPNQPQSRVSRILKQSEARAQLGCITYNCCRGNTGNRGSNIPRVGRERFDEDPEPVLDLPKRAESWFFEGFGATSEGDGGRRVRVDYPAGHLPKDFVDPEGSMRHGAALVEGRVGLSAGRNPAQFRVQIGRCRWG